MSDRIEEIRMNLNRFCRNAEQEDEIADLLQEIDRLTAELAEVKRDHAEIAEVHNELRLLRPDKPIGPIVGFVRDALMERDAAIVSLSKANQMIGRLEMQVEAARRERDAAIRERDACIPLASLPTEFVCGEWIMSGQAEPDAVVTYASEPSPETGHVGWCWWARGKMGEARDYVAAREAAEKSIRAHAAGSDAKGGENG